MTATTEKPQEKKPALAGDAIRLGGPGGPIIRTKLRRLDFGEVAPAGPNVRTFRVLTEDAGDERLVWDANSGNEINDAEAEFNQLVARGMTPYCVGTDGRRSAQPMLEFDPAAQEVIFVPTAVPRALVGG